MKGILVCLISWSGTHLLPSNIRSWLIIRGLVLGYQLAIYLPWTLVFFTKHIKEVLSHSTIPIKYGNWVILDHTNPQFGNPCLRASKESSCYQTWHPLLFGLVKYFCLGCCCSCCLGMGCGRREVTVWGTIQTSIDAWNLATIVQWVIIITIVRTEMFEPNIDTCYNGSLPFTSDNKIFASSC